MIVVSWIFESEWGEKATKIYWTWSQVEEEEENFSERNALFLEKS